MTHSVKSNTFPSCSSRRIKFIWPRHITKECKKSKKTQESGRLILENTDSYSCSACAWKSRSEHDTQFGFCITCCCRLACLCFHSFMINHANVQTMISTDIWSCADGFFFCFVFLLEISTNVQRRKILPFSTAPQACHVSSMIIKKGLVE